MNLREARNLISDEHVKEAARLTNLHGLDWLYERTGREPPRFRYVVIDAQRYPTKAFCYLAAQLAGNTDRKQNDMTVNESVAPLKRLGYVEVRGLGSTTTPEEEEARKRSYYLSLARPRQAAFRDTLLAAYEQRCVVTGCSVVQALEAAHVQPFEAGGIDALSNGLLLRVDLHRLFDAGYIAIEPDSFEVRISSKIGSDYKDIDGTRILIPKGGPSSDQLRPRWLEFVTG